MQTENGKVAESFCKSEMQDFFRYFVHPLAELCVAKRAQKEARMRDPPRYDCDGRMVTFTELVQHWGDALQAAWRGLEMQAWYADPNVDKECYMPTKTPYFLSFDNAPAHSLWVNLKRKVHLSRDAMPLSLLQIIRICPKGHDFHQIVEHAIGAIKGHVARQLADARTNGEPIETDVLWDVVRDGCSLFTAKSWDANLTRLNHALAIIAAEREEIVRFNYPDNVEREIPGQAGNYAPMFVS